MKSRQYRAQGPVLCLLLLGLISTPSGSTHSVLDLDPIDAGEIARLEELSEWVAEDSRFEARSEIKERQTSFEVFRSFHEQDVLYRGLAEIPFGEQMRKAGEQYGVDALLIAAVVEVESNFDPTAVSPRGAVGLMQVLPSTANLSREILLDPAANIHHGSRYLRRLLKRFEGDLELALAAYNAGPTAVRRFGGVPPFRETRNYVEKVLDLYIAHHRQVWLGSETHDLLLDINTVVVEQSEAEPTSGSVDISA